MRAWRHSLAIVALLLAGCPAPPIPKPTPSGGCPDGKTFLKELERLEGDGRLETALALWHGNDAERCAAAHRLGAPIAKKIIRELDQPRNAFAELDRAVAAKDRGDVALSRRLSARARFALRREAKQQERVVGYSHLKPFHGGDNTAAPAPVGVIPTIGEDMVARRARAALFRDRGNTTTPLLLAKSNELTYLPSDEIVTGPPWLRHVLEPEKSPEKPWRVLGSSSYKFFTLGPAGTEHTRYRGALRVRSSPLPGQGKIVGFVGPRVLRHHDGKLSLYERDGRLVAERDVASHEGLRAVGALPHHFVLSVAGHRTRFVHNKTLGLAVETSSDYVLSDDTTTVASFSAAHNPRVTIRSLLDGRVIAETSAPEGTSPQFTRAALSLHGDDWLLDARVARRLTLLDVAKGQWRIIALPPPANPFGSKLVVHERRAVVEDAGQRVCLSGAASTDVVDLTSGKSARLRSEFCAFGREGATVVPLPVTKDREIWPLQWDDTEWVASALRGEDGTVAFVELDGENNRPVLVIADSRGSALRRVPLLPSSKGSPPLLSEGFSPMTISELDGDHIVIATWLGWRQMAYIDLKSGRSRPLVSEFGRIHDSFARLGERVGSAKRQPLSLDIGGDRLLVTTETGNQAREHTIWNLSAGTKWGLSGPACDSALSPNGRFAVIATNCLPYQTLAQLYRLDGASPKPWGKEIDVHAVRHVLAVSGDGATVAMSDGKRKVELYDTTSGALRATLTTYASGLAIDSSGTLLGVQSGLSTQLWTASGDGYALKWEVPASTEAHLRARPRFVGDGRYLAVDNRLYEVSSGSVTTRDEVAGGLAATRWLQRANRAAKTEGRKPIGIRSMSTIEARDLVVVVTSDMRIEVLEDATGNSVATTVVEPHDRLIAFLEGGYVEVLGGGAPPKTLLCDFGSFATDFDACRERWLVTGGLSDVMRGQRSYMQLWK